MSAQSSEKPYEGPATGRPHFPERIRHMALPVLVSFTPENARETLTTLEHLRSAGKVPNDVHILIRKLRKALSDSGNGYA
mgnify:CR=1 FL=1